MGFEPITSAWKADNLPLIYTRINTQNHTPHACVQMIMCLFCMSIVL